MTMVGGGTFQQLEEQHQERTVGSRIELLDHGYIEVTDAWGSERGIIEAARMSTQKGFEGWGTATCEDCGLPWEDTGAKLNPPRCEKGRGGGHNISGKQGDEKLLAFLWRNKHHTPFEMAGMTFEVQAPIFVFREWHRHRVPFSYNEASARYAPLSNLNYVPSIERLMTNAGGTNKQAGTVADAKPMTEGAAFHFQKVIAEHYDRAENFYQWALKNGVPKELARVHLPVGRYSKMRASANLRGWLNLLALREAPNAQYEIRVYANAIHSMLAARFPRTLKLFEEK